MEQNLMLYHIFNTVAETGNISRAAKELYISQPAISKSISKLEVSLDAKLFVRSSRGVTLTDAGKTLYEHTSTAFRHLTLGEENLKRNQRLGVGHIRIGVSATLCRNLLLPYLQDFISQYPHIRISISCQSTYQTICLLASHKLDIGLIAKPGSSEPLTFDSVGKIEDIFVAAPSYLDNLRMREGDADLNVFQAANLMLLDEENLSRHYVDTYLKNHNIETGQVLEISSMDLLIDFARIGIGIACVIRQFVQEDIDQGRLHTIPLPEPMESREVGFAYRQDQPLSDSLQKFISFAKLH